MKLPIDTALANLFMCAFFAILVGFGITGCQQQGEPTGKTGNEWNENDFSSSTSALALEGGPEFAEFCKEAKTCELQGDVLEKFKEILKKYPVTNDEEFDHFAVVVRTRLVENGLLPQGDPERYQYTVSMLAATLGHE